MRSYSPFVRPILTALAFSFSLSALAQVPLPGQTNQAPVPGNMPPQTNTGTSQYQQLPLSQYDAQSRIEEIKQLVNQGRINKDVQERVYQLCEWLTDMANAHYKLAGVFSKHEQSKAQAELERKQAQKFSQLKNQAQLLKADLLIRQNRFPEALGPLIDIVSAEPRSATGLQAYKKLQQIGFSEEVAVEETKPTQAENPYPVAAPVSESKASSSATISRASTVSIEGYVGPPAVKTQVKPAVKTAPSIPLNKATAANSPLIAQPAQSTQPAQPSANSSAPATSPVVQSAPNGEKP